jgi:cytochrome b6-f complex iron-sulfur subunit
MKRTEFFSAVGFSAGMLFLAPAALTSCSKSTNDLTSGNDPGGTTGGTTGGTVDFSLDLSTTAYSALNTNGGSVYKNGLIIAKTMNGEYVALSAACTHEGSTIGFDSASNRFHCPNHGSNFTVSGSVINGPAATSLRKYNTQLSGTTLRVYA